MAGKGDAGGVSCVPGNKMTLWQRQYTLGVPSTLSLCLHNGPLEVKTFLLHCQVQEWSLKSEGLLSYEGRHQAVCAASWVPG